VFLYLLEVVYLVFFAIGTFEQRDCGPWQRPVFPTSGIRAWLVFREAWCIVPGKKSQSVIEDSSAECNVQGKETSKTQGRPRLA
jgi:hypothetical protein